MKQCNTRGVIQEGQYTVWAYCDAGHLRENIFLRKNLKVLDFFIHQNARMRSLM